MSDGASLALAFAITLGIVAGVVGLAGGVVWSGLGPEDRAAAMELLAPRMGVLLLVGILGVGLISVMLQPVIRSYFTDTRSLAEEARIMLTANPDYRIEPRGASGLRLLGEVLNEFAGRSRELREEIDAKIVDAKASVEEERNRLAALMSELTQGVLVCNREGRILLYNERARQLFAGGDAGIVTPVGLGRSIFGMIDRNLVAHGLDTVAQRLDQNDAHPVAHFLTTTQDGQLLRVHMAPVRGLLHANGERAAEELEVTGFVLTLDDVTRTFEDDTRRDRVLHELTEGSRAPLANIRAAAESLRDYGDMDDAQRTRFLHVIAEESRALSERLDRTMLDYADSLKTRWPLENVLGADLIRAAQRRIQSRVEIPAHLDEVDPTIRLEADSYSLTQALAYLAGRLKEEAGVREVRMRLGRSGRNAELDLAWGGATASGGVFQAWEEEPMRAGGEESPLSLKDVVERHAGEVWHQRGAAGQPSYFRLLIPTATAAFPARQAAPDSGSRPEYYDFDLFQQPGQTADVDARLLSGLAYTVFDTETTGLDPSAGDEIISIGAVRIVNGRLLRHEVFEQLIDPHRSIKSASMAIHGITPEMLDGQPSIERVLPAFRAFTEDTVLVAHNAAFDMRFLQLKEEATGVRFTQPVLDTLLLSEVLHANQKLHAIETIAERLGVNVVGRHTALGDAIVTAEVLLKMLPLLAEQGIRTLGEARDASKRTYYARVKY
jgi:DNA polymerase III subunit epsilon